MKTTNCFNTVYQTIKNSAKIYQEAHPELSLMKEMRWQEEDFEQHHIDMEEAFNEFVERYELQDLDPDFLGSIQEFYYYSIYGPFLPEVHEEEDA